MHIALFSPAWPIGRHPNGIVTYVDAMTTELRSQGHRVSIVSPEIDAAVDDVDVHPVHLGFAARVASALRTEALDGTPTIFRYGKAIASVLARIHARSPIDVIEMEESFGWVGQVARRIDVPVVVKLHGPAFVTMTESELRTAFGRKKVQIEHRSLARLQAITAPSRCTLDETLAHYGLHPAIAAHVVNPVPQPASASVWDRSRCEPDTLLFVGRFDAIKGGDLVIRAFRRLLADSPDLRLMFVGPDPGLQAADGTTTHVREFIASFAEPRLAERISVLGVLSPAEIGVLRLAAAVTVVASRRESQGYAALEAMLQGCPVVCTDTSGLSEIVEHEVTGLKARADDADDLAAHIARLLADPALAAALGPAARAYVIEHHAAAAVAHQTLDVYRRAIEQHHSRHAR